MPEACKARLPRTVHWRARLSWMKVRALGTFLRGVKRDMMQYLNHNSSVHHQNGASKSRSEMRVVKVGADSQFWTGATIGENRGPESCQSDVAN